MQRKNRSLELIPASVFDYRSNRQKQIAEWFKATHIFRWRYALSVSDLPKYVREQFSEITIIGSTTYQSSTWAVRI